MHAFAMAPTAPMKDAAALERARGWLVAAPLVLCVLLAKVALPVKQDSEIGLSLVLLPLIGLLGLSFGWLKVEPGRLLALLFMLAVLGAIQSLAIADYSVASLAMMATLFSTYVCSVPGDSSSGEKVLKFFLTFSYVMALLGIAQFALQFVAPREVAFPVEAALRKIDLLIQGFNYQIPLRYQSPVLKSNGVFFLEPSFFSQFLAVGIIAELLTKNRMARLGVYVVAYAMTYSGTGAMMLAVTLPPLLISRRRWDLIAIAGVCGAALLPFYRDLGLDVFLERATEFGQPGSSGFERFVGGFYMFDEFLTQDPVRALIGYGAGSFKYYVHRSPLPATELAFFKIVFEFGLIGALVFFGFIVYCLRNSGAPVLIRVAIGVSFLLNGMYVPSSHGLALTLLLWPWAQRSRLPRAYGVDSGSGIDGGSGIGPLRQAGSRRAMPTRTRDIANRESLVPR